MQSYAIKRGHYKNIEGVRLKDVMETTFGPVQDEGGTPCQARPVSVAQQPVA